MNDALTLVAVGQSLIKEGILQCRDPDFLEVLALTRGADASFTGYEGTIKGRHGGWPMKSTFLHASMPPVLDCLKKMGFNLLSLSNNHAFDLGPGGILSTLEEAEARGFTHAGIGRNLASAAQPAIRTTDRGTVALIAMDAGPQGEHVYALDAAGRIPERPGSNRLRVNRTIVVPQQDFDAIRSISGSLGHETKKDADRKVGFNQTPGEGFEFFGLRLQAGEGHEERRTADQADMERTLRGIATTAREARRVMVYVHHHQWEPDWEIVPAWFREFAHHCVDAGASLVVSHGVPMLQGIEIHRGAPIFYGLGNFIFHTFQPRKYTDERIWQSVIARIAFGDAGLDTIELYPIVIGGARALDEQDYDSRRVPHLARGEHGARILQRLARLSAAFGTRIEIGGGRGVIRYSSP